MPRVAVVMPAYNSETTIAEAVRSILDQTFGDFVLHVIDDCSTDDTAATLETISDPRLMLHRTRRNSGLPGALNLVIPTLDCEFIARMDADDIAHPQRLAVQIAFFAENPTVGICGTYAYGIDSEGNRSETNAATLPLSHDEIRVAMLFNAPFNHPTIMFNLAAIDRDLIRYRAEMVPAADYGLWTELENKTRFANIPQFLHTLRLSEGQISVRRRDEQIKRANALRVRNLRKLVPLPDPYLTRVLCQLGTWNAGAFRGRLHRLTALRETLLEANARSGYFDGQALQFLLDFRISRLQKSL